MDAHWNAAAHRLMAREVARIIEPGASIFSDSLLNFAPFWRPGQIQRVARIALYRARVEGPTPSTPSKKLER